MMGGHFKGFTNLYSLNKTLRFELIPQGETSEHIIAKWLDDTERAESYSKVKSLIDCRHREIINEVLGKFQFADKELNDLNSENVNADEDELDDFDNDKNDPLKKIRERLSKELTEKASILFSDKLINQSNEDDKCNLEIWLEEADDEQLELGNNEKVNRKTIIKDIKKMGRFWTYFGGFNENRKNIYSKEKIATSIPFRIIHTNFTIFKNNIKNYETIKNNHPELRAEIDKKGADEIFRLDYFNKCLTQGGIDIYNVDKLGIIATKQGETQDKGINQIINEYVQKLKSEKGEKANIAIFDKLKKQILSVRKTKSFQFKVFENTNEIINGINGAYKSFNELKPNIIRFLSDIDKHDLNEIYLNEKFINKLSKKVFDDGMHIELALKNNDIKEREWYSIETIQKVAEKDSDKIIKYLKNPTITIFIGEDRREEKNLFEEIDSRAKSIGYILNEKYDKDLKEEKSKDAEKIKSFLDALLEFNYILSHFIPKSKTFSKVNKDEEFYNVRKELQEQIFDLEILDLYNQTRNYVTQKPYSLDKIRLTFENPTLLNGWDVNKEDDNTCVLFEKDGCYFLGIINKSSKPKIKFDEMREGAVNYRKMVYKYFSDPSKMIPKCTTQLKDVEKHFKNSDKDYELKNDNFNKSIVISKQIFDLNNTVYDKESNDFVYRNKVDSRPKLFQKKFFDFANKNPELGWDERCKKALYDWIEFCKDFISKYKSTAIYKIDYGQKEFDTLDEFYEYIAPLMYEVKFQKEIAEEEIYKLVKDDRLWLFKIHNKDFSKYSTGKHNLHTLYWKMLFDSKNNKKENGKDTNKAIFKLDGGAEMFRRKATIDKDKITHPKEYKIAKKFYKDKKNGDRVRIEDKIVQNLNLVYQGKKREEELTEDELKYFNKEEHYSDFSKKKMMDGITKDKRYTKDKYQLHVPITLNFYSENEKNINGRVLNFLMNNKDVHIIGLDRGERNLIYLTMINKEGKIVDNMQLSLNNPDKNIDYNSLLSSREVSRTEARKNWQTLEGIKELKGGYLSLVVHKIAKLIVEKNAIVVMENLNYGFKDSRAKIEKNIYQKFESMLIKKLQYLVLDKKNSYEVGGTLSGYQLVNEKIPAYKDIGLQNGFLFYVPADYTSKIDPKTGFVNLLNTKFFNKDKAREFFEKFDRIYYDSQNGYFRFEFDYKKFGKLRVNVSGLKKTKWSVCSHPALRVITKPVNNKWVSKEIDVNDELKSLFGEKGISYLSGKSLQDDILKMNDDDFFRKLLRYLSILLTLRHTLKEQDAIIEMVKYATNNRLHHTLKEQDAIISSVEYAPNEFFNSKDEDKHWPLDADANGAFNIACKGLWLLQKLDKLGKKGFDGLKKSKEIKKVDGGKKTKVSQWCNNEEWLAYVQNKN